MRYVNAMHPVLVAIAPELEWPRSLREDDLLTMNHHVLHLMDQTRALARQAVSELAAAGQVSDPHLAVEARIMWWVADAGHNAHKIARTANQRTSTREGYVVFLALIASLALRAAEYDLGRSKEQRATSVLNRALGSAEWVAASVAAPPTTPVDAETLIRQRLLPGWWVETYATLDHDGRWRLVLASSNQRVTIKGVLGAAPTAVRERLTRNSAPVEMSWQETCQFLALPHSAAESSSPATSGPAIEQEES